VFRYKKNLIYIIQATFAMYRKKPQTVCSLHMILLFLAKGKLLP
jgi:hypothetical protein